MSDLLNQVFQAMNARLRSPFIGYFILAQIYLNYAAFILLLWGEGAVDDRVECFASTVTFERFVALPILASIVGGIVGPWIKFGGAWIAKWPTERLKKLQDDEARKIRIHNFEQAAEELEAEEGFNRKKIALAESLKLAEQVGGEQLLEDIKLGPRQQPEERSAKNEATESSTRYDQRAKEIGHTSLKAKHSSSSNPESDLKFDKADEKILLRFTHLYTPGLRRLLSKVDFPKRIPSDYFERMRAFVESSDEPWFQLSSDLLDMHLASFYSELAKLLNAGVYAFDYQSDDWVDVSPEIFSQHFDDDQLELFPNMLDNDRRMKLLSFHGNRCVKYGDELLRDIRLRAPSFYEEQILRVHEGEVSEF